MHSDGCIKMLTVNLVLVALFLLTTLNGIKSDNDIVGRVNEKAQGARGEWPFLTALFHLKNSEFFCGGTLITAQNVLTGMTMF